MFKRLLLIVGIGLLLPFVAHTQAQTPTLTEVSTLADYYPQATGWFFSFRTDDDYIDTLDRIIGHVDLAMATFGGRPASPVSFQPQQPVGEPPTYLRDSLNEFARQAFGGPFAETIRPWMGDSAAMGIMDWKVIGEIGIYDNADEVLMRGELPYLLALELSDGQAAFSAITPVLDAAVTEGDLTLIDAGAYRYYSLTDATAAVLLTPDALLFGTPDQVLYAIDTPTPTLTENPDFMATLEKLPETTYNGVMFVDFSMLMDGVIYAATEDPTSNAAFSEAELAFLQPFTNSVKGIGIGFTILADDVLTMDFVQNVDYTELSALGFQMSIPLRINPAFADHLPGNTAMVIMQSNIKALYESTIANLRATARLQADLGFSTDEQISESEIDAVIFAAGLGLRTFTDLNLQDDLLAWMDSDYALVMGISPEVSQVRRLDSLTSLPVDFGLVFDVRSDPDAAGRVVLALARAIDNTVDQYERDLDSSGVIIEQRIETIAGRDVLVVTVTDQFNTLPFPIEMLLGSNDEMMALGTRATVRAALTGDGGLRSASAYQQVEANLLVAEPGLLWFISSEALLPLADLYRISDPTNPFIEEDVRMIRSVLGLFTSATISGSNREDGTGVLRATISLNLPE